MCNNALITGIFGLVGTLAGGGVSFLAQYYYDHRKEKKDIRNQLINLHEKMTQDIRVINNTTQLLLEFVGTEISELDDFKFDEMYTQINSHVKECSLLWKDFRTVIIKYIPKIRKHKKFKLFEEIMELINYEYMGTKLDKMIKPTQEMLITRQELLSKSKDDICEAKSFLKEIENEYNKIIK
jgi:hypothetical protein